MRHCLAYSFFLESKLESAAMCIECSPSKLNNDNAIEVSAQIPPTYHPLTYPAFAQVLVLGTPAPGAAPAAEGYRLARALNGIASLPWRRVT